MSEQNDLSKPAYYRTNEYGVSTYHYRGFDVLTIDGNRTMIPALNDTYGSYGVRKSDWSIPHSSLEVALKRAALKIDMAIAAMEVREAAEDAEAKTA